MRGLFRPDGDMWILFAKCCHLFVVLCLYIHLFYQSCVFSVSLEEDEPIEDEPMEVSLEDGSLGDEIKVAILVFT